MNRLLASSNESFNDWGGGRGCHKFVPVLGGDGTKIDPHGDLRDQPSSEMSWIRGKLADHIGDHVVLSPEGVILVTTPGTESSYPRPPPPIVGTLELSININIYGRHNGGRLDTSAYALLLQKKACFWLYPVKPSQGFC